MDFTNLYAQGFARVAARVLPVHLAMPLENARAIIDDVRDLWGHGVVLAAYPELSETGYSCDDLFAQETLLDATEAGLAMIVEASRQWGCMVVVGAPIRVDPASVYNCAVVIAQGEILGVVPKAYLPNYREFYENRWFAPSPSAGESIPVTIAGHQTWLRTDRSYGLAGLDGLKVWVEVCEDMWVPIPPSASGVLDGATVVVNISGSPITIGKAEDRLLLARSASLRGQSAYVFTAAGPGESSTDLSWDGQAFVCECGEVLAQSQRFPTTASGVMVDIDLARIQAERTRMTTFERNHRHSAGLGPTDPVRPSMTRPGLAALDAPAAHSDLLREVARFPFVPNDPARLAQDCYEAYNIQVYGLVRRMQAIGSPKLVIGVSGGLDSTHALIVCAKAMDLLGRDRSEILAFTMPGFATSQATKASALHLMDALGVTAHTLDIRPAATQMLTDLGHPFADGQPQYDVTFENVQAGLRTDYLFRIANQRGGIVVGTGDLSELALGWCTYGVGDQMSHYAVNTGVPKTLIQYLIRWVISADLVGSEANEVLETILAQEISPELVPVADGKSMQSTESIIGPYALHDFFLYHFLRRGAKPSRIAYLAWMAWRDVEQGSWPLDWAEDRKVSYDLHTIRAWLEFFLSRFFANQFKRSAIPNGPKVAAGGTLSPRGDWRMPSDASAHTWLQELHGNVPLEDSTHKEGM
ncbi:MAG: NAD(+) synthase [Propionibacteriaceae bacterium]|jgi:NAD+ synthase (glutamine-hydrolysing)|nr:NAD(+) synthase [Propionibacteriaceae bacterium]